MSIEPKVANFINGTFYPPNSGEYLDNIDPSTAARLSLVPISDKFDIDQAVQAGKKALSGWSNLPTNVRAKFLLDFADAINKRLQEFAKAESQDTGKPLALALNVDIPRSADNFRFYAQMIRSWSSDCHYGEAGLNYTLRQPKGVVACISPWNFPLHLLTWKIAPALAAGNVVIAKPSELTPSTAYLLSEVATEIGLPSGVLNILHGPGSPTGNAILDHPDIRTISFTGGSETGRHIAIRCAEQLKAFSLELGGKNPCLIFADTNIDQAVDEIVRSSFTNQGQVCLSSSRIYVEEPIYEAFKSVFVSKVSSLVIGDPMLPQTHQGAIASESHFRKILSAIEGGKADGGRILTGGQKFLVNGRCQHGFFIEPTVIEGLPIQNKLNQAEIFGPVVTLASFKNDDEALKLANHSLYGLSASIWTSNLNRAHQLSAAIKAGIVWVNSWNHRDLRTPFGGVGQSGFGREGGVEALRFFTEAKNICLNL